MGSNYLSIQIAPYLCARFQTLHSSRKSMNKFKTTTVFILQRILPENIRNSLLHLSFHLARPEFDRFAYEHCFAPNMELGLAAATKRGLLPRTIIDVGAYHGDWSRMARHIWPDGRIIMFEPNV